MKKLFFLAVPLLLILGGCAGRQNDVRETDAAANALIMQEDESIPDAPVEAGNDDVSSGAGSALLTDIQNGVKVEVRDVRADGDKTVITFSVDNHSIDFSGLDPMALSSLGGARPTLYAVTGVEMGGHHIDAQLIFDAKAAGHLLIAFNDELAFNFDLP